MHEGQLAIIWLLLSTLALFALIFGVRYISNKENMAMIEKGLNPREYSNRPVPYRNLKWGLLLIGAGVGLLMAFLVDSLVYFKNIDPPVALYFALIAIGGGLGLVSSYRIEKKELLDRENK
jgi:hypothetical protein